MSTTSATSTDSPSRPGVSALGRGSSGLHVLSETRGLLVRRLRHMRAAPGRLVGVILNPLVMLIAVGYLFKEAVRLPPGVTDYLTYLMPGIALQVGLASVGPTAISICNDVQRGLMDRFRSLPITRASVLIAHSLADLALAAVALVALLLLGVGLGWRPETDATGLVTGALIALAFAYTMIWVGIALGIAMKQPESIDSVGALLLVTLTFLSTAVLPPGGLPGWLLSVAQWNPVSIVAQLCREQWGTFVATGSSLPVTSPVPVAAVMLSVVLVGCASWALRTFVRRG